MNKQLKLDNDYEADATTEEFGDALSAFAPPTK